MNSITSKLNQLKSKLETTAFLVSKQGCEQQAHSEIVQCLIILNDIETTYNTKNDNYKSKNELKNTQMISDDEQTQEVKKVARRLKLWAKHQEQINSKILNTFLKLKRSGFTMITESQLRNELAEITSFESNFTQMKTIAVKNHGKVFDQYGEQVTLWQPIILHVQEYERTVFGSSNE